MAVLKSETMPLQTSEDIVRVRQAVRAWAIELGFSLVEQTKIVTAASELARNTLDHGGGGEARVEHRRLVDHDQIGVERVVAIALEPAAVRLELEQAVDRRRLHHRGLAEPLGRAAGRRRERDPAVDELGEVDDRLDDRGLADARAAGDHRALVDQRCLDRAPLLGGEGHAGHRLERVDRGRGALHQQERVVHEAVAPPGLPRPVAADADHVLRVGLAEDIADHVGVLARLVLARDLRHRNAGHCREPLDGFDPANPLAYFREATWEEIVALSKKEEVQLFADWCLSFGDAGILINNAGIYLPGDASNEADGFLEMMMNTNLYSAYHLSRKIIPSMIHKGSGHIFNICSVASMAAYNGGGGYSISKFALHGFTKNLRHELKPKGIKVTGVYPGAVLTDSWGNFDNSNKRIMEATDIAAMVFAAAHLSVQAVVDEIIITPQLGEL